MSFPQPAEVNYRAIRNMGLAAWWGGSLGTLASLARAAKAMPDPATRFRVLDAGYGGSRRFVGIAISSYVIGTQLVRYDGKILSEHGTPRWLVDGPENGLRTALTAVGIVSAVAGKRARARAGKELREHGHGTERFERDLKTVHACNVVTAACGGGLLYSHLKEDMGY